MVQGHTNIRFINRPVIEYDKKLGLIRQDEVVPRPFFGSQPLSAILS